MTRAKGGKTGHYRPGSRKRQFADRAGTAFKSGDVPLHRSGDRSRPWLAQPSPPFGGFTIIGPLPGIRGGRLTVALIAPGKLPERRCQQLRTRIGQPHRRQIHRLGELLFVLLPRNFGGAEAG